MPIPLLPNSLYGDIEASTKPETAAISILPERIEVKKDKTATEKGTAPKKSWAFGNNLYNLASDYTAGNPFFATLGGTGDAAIAAAWLYPPTHNLAESAREAASGLYNVPTAVDPDFWKKAGKAHREAIKGAFTLDENQKAVLQDERNRAKLDLYNAFIPPIPYIDY